MVADAQAAREELVARGVECSEIQVFDERDGGTLFGFADPDGNTWAVQQLKVRAEQPLIPHDTAAASAEASSSDPAGAVWGAWGWRDTCTDRHGRGEKTVSNSAQSETIGTSLTGVLRCEMSWTSWLVWWAAGVRAEPS